MTSVLTIRVDTETVAQLKRRAAALGRTKSEHARRLIEEDLQRGESSHRFASADLAGRFGSSYNAGDNATVRRAFRESKENR